jgi:hypothetical protein
MFLLLGILSISARFTTDLSQRFGSSMRASEFFLNLAHVMIAEEMWRTTLENTQAFFLLGMAEWGRGDRNRSAIDMGIAVRMAGVLRLHREESYKLPPSASADDIVKSEAARRTFWVIQNHDNLYTQQHLPVSFAKCDITTLLPSDESDFAFGRISALRAALSGTVPAKRDPTLISPPKKSLFATLIQAHDLWGMIARDTFSDVVSEGSSADFESEPWVADCRYQRISHMLSDWEAQTPNEHKWSAWNLRGFKAEHVDLAYLSIVTIARLNNIVLRRQYLETMIDHIVNKTVIKSAAPPGFWEDMAADLFSNVWELYESIDTWFSLRSAEDGFPAMLAFCTYICGSLASYVYKWPGLCQKLVPTAEKVLQRSLEVLVTFQDKWSTVMEWVIALRKVAEPMATWQSVNQVQTPEHMMTHGSGPYSDYTNSPKNTILSLHSQSLSTPGSKASPTTSTAAPTGEKLEMGPNPDPNSTGSPFSSNPRSLSRNADPVTYNSYMAAAPDGSQEVLRSTNNSAAGPSTTYDSAMLAPWPANLGQLPSPESPSESTVRESMDSEFADIVQGYVNFGWGWQQSGGAT